MQTISSLTMLPLPFQTSSMSLRNILEIKENYQDSWQNKSEIIFIAKRSALTAFYKTERILFPEVQQCLTLIVQRSIRCQSDRKIILFSFLRQHTAKFIVFHSFTVTVNKLAS